MTTEGIELVCVQSRRTVVAESSLNFPITMTHASVIERRFASPNILVWLTVSEPPLASLAHCGSLVGTQHNGSGWKLWRVGFAHFHALCIPVQVIHLDRRALELDIIALKRDEICCATVVYWFKMQYF
jgi:hypothetical protein